jgi:hypothetical protein
LRALLKRLNKIDLSADVALQVVAVNDGSAAPAPGGLNQPTWLSGLKIAF